MNPLHEQFIAESRELIQQASDDLIVAEREGPSKDRVDRILRAFHTLKGSAGLVQLPSMSLVLHAAEDLLAAVQAGRLQAGAALISGALECLDQVSRWIDAFENDGTLPARADEEARIATDRLRDLLSSRDDTGTPLRAARPALPNWVASLMAVEHEAIVRQLGGSTAPLFAIAYEPHEDCFLDGEDPLKLLRQIPRLLALRIELREEPGPLEAFDPYACRLRLHAIAQTDRETLSSLFRLVPDQVRIYDLPPPENGRSEVAETAVAALVRAVIEEQREVLRSGDQGDLDGRIGAAARAAANALRHFARPALAEDVTHAGAAARSQKNIAPLLAALGRSLDRLVTTDKNDDIPAALSTPTSRSEEAEGSRSRWLRVDEERVEMLVNLAGELIISKNSLAHLAKRIESEIGDKSLSRSLRDELEEFDRLGRSLHGAILQLRMIPVGQVMRAFPRLVRDLSLRLGKQVQFTTSGEATESDKVVIDRLFEPLLHLVRNALDHGIERPEERRADGKTEVATLTMQARRLGDRLILEVGDDGRGIDPAAVKRKAGTQGLLADEALAALSDAQALELIFTAGFSTAAEISDVSGRGVGMDVVRATVAQIGGRVTLASQVGSSTTVRLDLPVSIATARIMVVECAGQCFGIPMDAVIETVRLTPERISEVKNNEGFVFRNRVVPVCSLAELLHVSGRSTARSDTRLMIVLETGGKIAAVEVDAITDRLDVVLKPMQGVLASARGYAGTTVLADGSVLLVLDLKEMLP